ncbi:MAG TPA: two-component system response regulator [Stellaceae bacterium]|nr:two-component system response regulator [Stellaceae bacterium]
MPPDSGLERPIVLVVDDTPDNLRLMSSLLKDLYRLKVANSGERGLAIAQSDPRPDLILLDVVMPVMDGQEVCRRLKQDARTRDIPVIFLTAKSEIEDEEAGLRLGAVDYITKPISPPIVLARVETHLKLKASADFLRDKAEFLEQEVAGRTREVVAIQDVTILVLASLAETRDTDTGSHIRRTQHYVRVLAEHLRGHPRFADTLTDPYISTLFKSAPLHDIGKVGIPDRILLKPGKLDPDEWAIMKTHAALGREAIEQAERSLGTQVGFLTCAKEIAQSHHEKWDGSGYPDGLGGDDIPICARLMAAADVYDALISRRVYKDGMSHEAAAQIIVRGSGSHFDPDVVDAFEATAGQFRAIAAKYADSDADLNRKREMLEQFQAAGAATS